MYNQFFKLHEKPFNLTPKADLFHDNEGISPAYNALVEGVNQGDRVLLLTGDTGTGKTLCAQRLLAELESNVEYCGISIPFTSLPLDDMLGYICGELNLNFGLGRNENKLEILEMFLTHGVSPIRKVVIVIDEAQNLDADVFDGLADLLDISKNAQRDVQIVVMARNESDLKLNHPHMMAFSHHITLRCHLQTLAPHETASYIKYQLKAAGAAYSDLFTEEAVARVHSLTQGRARAINTLCDQALNVAAAENEAIINIEHVNTAHKQQQFDDTIEMQTSMISDAITRMMDERDSKKNIPEEESVEGLASPEEELIMPAPEVLEPAVAEPEVSSIETEIPPIEFQEKQSELEGANDDDEFSKTYHNIPVQKSGNGFLKFVASLTVVAAIAWYFFPQLQAKYEEYISSKLNPETLKIDALTEEEVSPKTELEAVSKTPDVIQTGASVTEVDNNKAEQRVLLDDDAKIQETATHVNETNGMKSEEQKESREVRTINEPLPSEPFPEVEQLFGHARYQVSVLQLTSPRNDNALNSYKQILEIDPGNVRALEGIEDLKEMFLSWAESNEQANNLEKAKKYYRRLLIIEPDNTEIIEKLASLEEQNHVPEEKLQIESGLLGLAVEGKVTEIRTLLGKGAYPDVQDKKGNTALMLATDVGSVRVVNALLEGGASPNLRNKIGETALINAVWKNQLEIADLLLTYDASVNANNNRGWTALMYAAIHGHTELFNKLLEHGANQEAKTEDNKTVLTIAAHNGQHEIVKVLIDNGARVNGKDKDGWTPLMHAVWNSHADVVQTLLVSESNINQQNIEGWTPLMMAAWSGKKSIVEMLLRNGADKTLRNPAGSTALDLANDQQNHAVSSLLR